MNISEEINKYLKAIGSKAVLGKTVYGTYHDTTAWAYKGKRGLTVSRVESALALTIKDKGFCVARYRVPDLETVANLMHLWLDQKESILEIKHQFPEIELFENFQRGSISENKKIERSWNEIKNCFFKEEYSIPHFHLEVFEDILNKAKVDPLLQNYYLYNSHQRICFSNRRDSGWTHYLCICWEQDQEKFVVNTPPDSKQLYFNDLDEAFETLKKYLDKIDDPEKP